ncbi:MAG: methylated-DNA--[protein]-cysteine S-methyltransferase [Proteobacteria bacterium]|nr:methylated-DNA--[protein]-cysteine S-methyltransferase [Pseudomonadota bacterium]MDA1132643.1 methylated-DNA--[protein]-cysteine S-methyltransferase [Pseudomonadota bacterium]
MTGKFVYASSVGFLHIEENEHGVTSVSWKGPPARNPYSPNQQKVQVWLEDYFQGHFRPPDFALASTGTPFRMQVWQLLLQVPAGQVTSYGELAKALDTSPRAIGGACRANPVPILVPCHRVVASDGSLGGYSGGKGLETKARLLRHEGVLT